MLNGVDDMHDSGGVEGRSRTCVFQLFGVIFGYATHHLDARRLGEVGVVGR
ncbi:hypothetical protein GCM10017752_44620 [Streptomyces roseoviridis]